MQAAVRVSAGPRVLYLGISLLDAGLKMSRQSGRKMDCVQRQVLGVTCLYLACYQSTPFRSGMLSTVIVICCPIIYAKIVELVWDLALLYG